MKILAIEFSSKQRSVAVGVDGEIVGYSEESNDSALSPFKLIDSALNNAKVSKTDIECISVGTGPGSYTGIRIAISIAQGWQLARNIKLLGVNSAESIAEKLAFDKMNGKYRILIDAQRGEFYCSEYDVEQGQYKCVNPLRIVKLNEISKDVDRIIAGYDLPELGSPGVNVFPDAKSIYRLSLKKQTFINGEQLEPIYLRQVAFVKAPPPRIFDIT
ncbi:MAG: tRNA (adenosine(37)-N6)-threonylcarbamoyltransferase complex dimerization subunit type 1 TsaB [Verrucomicrobiia bacterium]|jgi:tRNA threonylcarbamoyladenosine biosynthesis protein TsaB